MAEIGPPIEYLGGMSGEPDREATERFTLKVMDRHAQLVMAGDWPSLAKIKARYKTWREESPEWVSSHDFLVEDNRNGTEYHFDTYGTLIEM